MPEYQVISMINGKPTFEVPLSEILKQLRPGWALKIISPAEYITDRQRRYYKGYVLPTLAKNDENGETVGFWDIEVKKRCKGLDYLNKEIFYYQDESGHIIPIGRLTTKGVGKKNMSMFLEEILSVSVIEGWPISPPDENLRKCI